MEKLWEKCTPNEHRIYLSAEEKVFSFLKIIISEHLWAIDDSLADKLKLMINSLTLRVTDSNELGNKYC